MHEDSPYYSMHSNLHKLEGMTEQEAISFVEPFGYKIAVIPHDGEMVEGGWNISVTLDKNKRIEKVFAWSRPVLTQTDGCHPDAWNDSWLDTKQTKILLDFIKNLKPARKLLTSRCKRVGPEILENK